MNDEYKTKEQLMTELTALRQRVAELEIVELKYFQLKANLHERAKELTCIYDVVRIIDNPNITLHEIYQQVVNVLPMGWQYREITHAKIVIGDKEFKTLGYRDTKWKISSYIEVYGEKRGTIEVCYLEEKPKKDKGPFLNQELMLLSIVAGRIGRVTERRQDG
jgi:hypothetical protein